MNIPKKYLEMCCMKTLKESKEFHGDNDETLYTFCDTFLIQSDKRVLQYLRECSLNMDTSLSYEEYIELEEYRQECVKVIRSLN